MELRGQGFAGALSALPRTGKELYVTVRGDCLREFLRKYEIEEYRLIRMPPCGVRWREMDLI